MKPLGIHARCDATGTNNVSRRAFLGATGALVVGFSLPGRALAQMASGAQASLAKSVDAADVDGFLAIGADGTITIFCGKVDIGLDLVETSFVDHRIHKIPKILHRAHFQRFYPVS